MKNIKQIIESKIDTLNHIEKFHSFDDNWMLETLIRKYNSLISVLDTSENIDIKKIVTYIESLEEEFKHFNKISNSSNELVTSIG